MADAEVGFLKSAEDVGHDGMNLPAELRQNRTHVRGRSMHDPRIADLKATQREQLNSVLHSSSALARSIPVTWPRRSANFPAICLGRLASYGLDALRRQNGRGSSNDLRILTVCLAFTDLGQAELSL